MSKSIEELENQIEEKVEEVKKLMKRLKDTSQYNDYTRTRHSLFQSQEYKAYTKARDAYTELDLYKQKAKAVKEKKKLISLYLSKREEEEYN